jgi:hypothetical protein
MLIKEVGTYTAYRQASQGCKVDIEFEIVVRINPGCYGTEWPGRSTGSPFFYFTAIVSISTSTPRGSLTTA